MLDKEKISFKSLGLSPKVSSHLSNLGYKSPTPIQQKSIPILLKGKNLLGQAQTGTGKTAAFALPLINNLNKKAIEPQILVLTPTRELAIQVSEAFAEYAKNVSNFRGVTIYGGQSIEFQFRELKKGAHVVVGTPGRIMDHMRRRSLSLSSINSVVLDEADEMLKMGFVEDIEWILEKTPIKKQVALFSATMPERIKKIAKKYLNDAKHVKIKSEAKSVENIKQFYWKVSGINKLDAVSRILDVEETDGTIIFVRTKTTTVDLAEKLKQRGFNVAALNGDLGQALREKTIDMLKEGTLDIVVATDVVARGIDVERVSHVINYDAPFDSESYIHRIGRTGRAGRNGKAILFISNREMKVIQSIEKNTKQKIAEYELPSKKDLSVLRVQRFKELIKETASGDLSFYENIIKELEKEGELDLKSISATLCYLVQKEKPFLIKEEVFKEEKIALGIRKKPRTKNRRRARRR